MCFNASDLFNEAKSLHNGLNEEQKKIYEAVLDSVELEKGFTFFVYGYGGTGKTYLYKTIISALRSQGKIVLPVTSSALTTLLFSRGRTAHSRFKIPIDINENFTCNIKKEHN